MGVALGNDDRRMSQQVTYLCQWNSSTNQPSRAGVTKIVDVKVLDRCTTAGRVEAPFDRLDLCSVFLANTQGSTGNILHEIAAGP